MVEQELTGQNCCFCNSRRLRWFPQLVKKLWRGLARSARSYSKDSPENNRRMAREMSDFVARMGSDYPSRLRQWSEDHGLTSLPAPDEKRPDLADELVRRCGRAVIAR